jgi:hypothetical protein
MALLDDGPLQNWERPYCGRCVADSISDEPDKSIQNRCVSPAEITDLVYRYPSLFTYCAYPLSQSGFGLIVFQTRSNLLRFRGTNLGEDDECSTPACPGGVHTLGVLES